VLRLRGGKPIYFWGVGAEGRETYIFGVLRLRGGKPIYFGVLGLRGGKPSFWGS